MAGFEISITDQELARRARGVPPRSIIIARSALLRDNLEGFIDTSIKPQELKDGDDVFGGRYFSGITPSGTMLHIRSYGNGEDGVIPAPDKQFAVVTGSLNDRVTYTYTTTTVERQRTYDGRDTLDILLGRPSEYPPGLRLVDEDTSARDKRESLELERYLDAYEATQSLAQVTYNGNSWFFRHGYGGIEPLRDLEMVKREVDEAISRGLAKSAITPLDYPINHEQQPTGTESN